MKRGAVPARMSHQFVVVDARSNHLDEILEYFLAVGMNEICREETDEFVARAAVHCASSRVGINDTAGFQIDEDQPVMDSIENV